MSSIHRWWNLRATERYWLEVTDRPDIGLNLKAPTTNERGNDFWGYSFLKEVVPGDIIFHYDKNAQAITSRSVASGEPWSDVITWAARGSYARAAGIAPHLREGIYLGLESYTALQPAVTLVEIREKSATINQRLAELETAVSAPLYYPFERSRKREVRPVQGYLFKLPAFFLQLFPSLEESLMVAEPTQTRQTFGMPYRRPSENQAVAKRDPFAVDPSIVERGLKGHAITQNLLSDAIAAAQLSPLSSTPAEPPFDVAWRSASTIWVAEVKSLTHKNEEKQLRLGLGQVLRYAHLLTRQHGVKVRPVLVVERKPTCDDWLELCDAHNVLLLWPPFHGKILEQQ